MAAAALALGAAACFSDPTSSLRNGPATLQLSQYTVTLKAGDSLSIRALVLDGQGNQLDVGTPTWTSADPTVATVRADAAAPGNIFAPAVVVGINNQAGVTTVTLDDQGLQATVRVTVLPATFPSAPVITGTAVADTVIISRPAPLTPLVVPYTKGDTLTLNATATVTFSATTSTVSFGAFSGYIIRRSATQLVVMSRQPFAGKPVVTNLTYAGTAATGSIAIASMPVDSVQLQHSRFHGVAAVVGDTITLTASGGSTFSGTTGLQFTGVPATIFSQTATTIRAIAPILSATSYTGGFTVYNLGVGAATADSAHSFTQVTMNRATFPGTATVSPDTLIVTPSANTTFNTAATNKSAVKFGSGAGIVFVLASGQMKVLANANYTGTVTVTNVLLGTARIDSLKTTGSVSINKAVFPGAVANGAGRLLDTVVVASTAAAKFTPSGASASSVTLSGKTTLVISRTADTMKVISVVGSSGPLTVSNVVVGSSTIPSLTTAGNVAVSTAITGEVNEPTNDSKTTPTVLAFTGAADTITVYGSLDCEDDGTACPGNGDYQDFYSFTTSATQSLRAIVTWFGAGNAGFPAGAYGSDKQNPDLDVIVCNNTACSYGTDLAANSGAGLGQPETASTGSTQVAGTYRVGVFAYATATPIAYRLRILRF